MIPGPMLRTGSVSRHRHCGVRGCICAQAAGQTASGHLIGRLQGLARAGVTGHLPFRTWSTVSGAEPAGDAMAPACGQAGGACVRSVRTCHPHRAGLLGWEGRPRCVAAGTCPGLRGTWLR